MENLAIKVIMQNLGGGIRRVHHLRSGSSVGDFSGCRMQARADSRGLTFLQASQDLSTNKTSLGTQNSSHGIRNSEEIRQQTYSQSSRAQSVLVIFSVHYAELLHPTRNDAPMTGRHNPTMTAALGTF